MAHDPGGKVYEINIKDRAIRQLSAIPVRFAEKIDELIQSLSHNPRRAGSKKLQGYDNIYRIRYSDYRIIYSIEDKTLIIENHTNRKQKGYLQ